MAQTAEQNNIQLKHLKKNTGEKGGKGAGMLITTLQHYPKLTHSIYIF